MLLLRHRQLYYKENNNVNVRERKRLEILIYYYMRRSYALNIKVFACDFATF